MEQLLEQAQQAASLGFDAIAAKLHEKAEMARKLAIAYEHYRYVPASAVAAFNAKLRVQTNRPTTPADRDMLEPDRYFGYPSECCDQLVFTPISEYQHLPPADVLEKVKEALNRGCFDVLEIAKISPVATKFEDPDPIVFGRVTGCDDRFFIAEWGTDVKLTDLIDGTVG